MANEQRHVVFALPCKCNLKDLVSSYERGQSGQALFAWTPHTHQQGVPSRCPDYPWHLRKQNQCHQQQQQQQQKNLLVKMVVYTVYMLCVLGDY